MNIENKITNDDLEKEINRLSNQTPKQKKQEEQKEKKYLLSKAQHSYKELRKLNISQQESKRYIEKAYSCIGRVHFQDKIMKYAIRQRKNETWDQDDFEIYLEALFFGQQSYKD